MITRYSMKKHTAFWRRLPLGITVLILILIVTLFILNNNISLRPLPQAEFCRQLDVALELSTQWLESRAHELAVTKPNTALLHMIDDMADLSQDPRLRQITESFLQSQSRSLWRRMVNETVFFQTPPTSEVSQYQDYQRWILHALAPSQVVLTPDDLASMFSPTAHYWGSLTHQVFSLYIYRKHQGSTSKLDNVVDRLCERIAFEAIWDIRVTDLYLQRIAFLLAAGRPDLVKRRWVERLLAHQKASGGWQPAWYGWGPDLFRFTLTERPPDVHATAQGAWVLYMLKYRYPNWSESHYRTRCRPRTPCTNRDISHKEIIRLQSCEEKTTYSLWERGAELLPMC